MKSFKKIIDSETFTMWMFGFIGGAGLIMFLATWMAIINPRMGTLLLSMLSFKVFNIIFGSFAATISAFGLKEHLKDKKIV